MGKNWLENNAESNAAKDQISQSGRFGNVVGSICILLVIFFFVTHKSQDTGFFTEGFGQLEALLFYLPPLMGIIHNVAQAIAGRKNLVRPIEIVSSPVTLVCIIGLYGSFPFDFSHFPDVLPKSLQFLVGWVSDGLVKFFMVIGIIACIGVSIYTPILYLYVRQILSGERSGI